MSPNVRSVKAITAHPHGTPRAKPAEVFAPGRHGTIPKTPDGRAGGTWQMHGEEPPTIRSKGREEVHLPGEPHYAGHNSTHYEGQWPKIAESMNNASDNHRSYAKQGRRVAAIALAPVAASAATVPLVNRKLNQQSANMNAKAAAKSPVAKFKVPKLANPLRMPPGHHVYDEANIGMRNATRKGDTYKVTSLGERQHPADYHAPPLERLGEKSVKAADNGVDVIGAAIGGGVIGAGLVHQGGTARARKRNEAAAKNYRKRPRKAVAPVAKSFKMANVKAALSSPKAFGATVRTYPKEFAIGGGGAVVAGGAGGADHKHRKSTAAASATGAAGGQAAFYGGGFAAVRRSNKLKMKAQKTGHNGMSRAAQEKTWKDHRKSHGYSQGTHMDEKTSRAIFSSYPKQLPGWRTQRLAAHMQGGKKGMLVNAGVTAGGATMTGGAVHAVGKKPVEKMWKPKIPKIRTKAKAKVQAKVTEGLTAVLKPVIKPIDKPIVQHAMAAAAAGGLVGGGIGAGMGNAVGRRKSVAKGLYTGEKKTSVLRAAELGVGAGVGAWGLGRSRMLGVALARGVKMANKSGNRQAFDALRMAQATQGLLNRGTAPGERAVRQIRALNSAVNRVPASLRPEIAAAAGLLLVGHAHPVRTTHYSPATIRIRVGRPT